MKPNAFFLLKRSKYFLLNLFLWKEKTKLISRVRKKNKWKKLNLKLEKGYFIFIIVVRLNPTYKKNFYQQRRKIGTIASAYTSLGEKHIQKYIRAYSDREGITEWESEREIEFVLDCVSSCCVRARFFCSWFIWRLKFFTSLKFSAFLFLPRSFLVCGTLFFPYILHSYVRVVAFAICLVRIFCVVVCMDTIFHHPVQVL